MLKCIYKGIYIMKKDTTLLIRINSDLKSEIQEIADKNGVTVSEIINVYLADIAKKGDINLITKGKLGVIAREMKRGRKLDFFTIKNAIEESIKKCELEEKIEKVYLYGSYARGEATIDSDIDLRLVTTDEISGFDIGYLRYEIKEKTGKDVDISNLAPEKLDPEFYFNVKKDEICIYEKS